MFVKARGNRLYEEVVNQIKTLIDNGQLADGDILPSETELSKSIGVSRATVREGLRILELMGLVKTRRGRGTFVSLNDNDSLMKRFKQSIDEMDSDSYYVYETDELLEPGIARRAAEKAEEKDLQKMKACLDRMEDSIKRGDLLEAEAESLIFHKCIIDVLGNPILDSIFDLTREIHTRSRTVSFSFPKRATETLNEHAKIYEAIKEKDGNKAFRYMKRHLKRVGDTYNKLTCIIEDSDKG